MVNDDTLDSVREILDGRPFVLAVMMEREGEDGKKEQLVRTLYGGMHVVAVGLARYLVNDIEAPLRLQEREDDDADLDV